MKLLLRGKRSPINNVNNSVSELDKYFLLPSYRSGQKEAIQSVVEALLNPNIKYVLLSAPTGTGKSVIGLTVANYFAQVKQQRSFLITSEKILQDQYQKSFYDTGMVKAFLKGKENYGCAFSPKGYGAGPCHGNKKIADFCKAKGYCDYKKARASARAEKICVLNYALAVTEFDYLPKEVRMPPADLVICDEAHNLEEILVNYATISTDNEFFEDIDTLKIKYNEFVDKLRDSQFADDLEFMNDLELEDIKEFRKMLITKFSFNVEDENYFDDHYVEFLRDVFFGIRDTLSENLINVTAVIDNYYNILEARNHFSERDAAFSDLTIKKEVFEKDDLYKMSRSLNNLVNKLKRHNCKISNMEKYWKSDRWVFSIEKDLSAFVLKPLYGDYLWNVVFESEVNKNGKYVFMSATLPSKRVFASNLGIDENSVLSIELEHPFPLENRRVHYYPIAKMNYASIEQSKYSMLNFIKDFCEDGDKKTKKILIHTSNYSLSKFFTEELNKRSSKLLNWDRFITHSTAKDRNDALTLFMTSKDPLVLISPSLTEGLSLEGDESQIQLITKFSFNVEDENYFDAHYVKFLRDVFF